MLASIARLLIVVTCGVALYQLAPVVAAQWQGQSACPMLGPLPACYLVLLGYSAMAAGVLWRGACRQYLFVGGWLPVFLLALSGTLFELGGRVTCPRNAAAEPMCFYSLAIASGLMLAYLLMRWRWSKTVSA